MAFPLNRRQYLARAAAAVPALLPQSVRAKTPANDAITVGVIGLGSRGYNLVDALLAKHSQARIVAICDVDRHHFRDRPWGTGNAFGLEPAKKKIESAYAKLEPGTGKGLLAFADFRELVALDSIDAVVVATPDHWHAACTMAALQAGKDVYCEKPVTHFFAEGQAIYREVAKRGAVFQTGSQQRSDAKFRRAVELARNGILGRIESVEVGLPPGYKEPQGDANVAKVPKQLNYDMWCGPAEVLPYMRARHHRWWRGHRAYGGGVLMDWIGHHNDIAHWALDMDNSGPTHIAVEEWSLPTTAIYNTPHHYTLRCTYEGGITSTISSRNTVGLKLIGDNGWAYVTRGKLRTSDPRWARDDFQVGEIRVTRSDDHMQNFLDCIGSRKPCVAPAETAHRSITPGHLGYVAAALNRSLRWDPAAEQVLDDAEANEQLQSLQYREPWQLSDVS